MKLLLALTLLSVMTIAQAETKVYSAGDGTVIYKEDCLNSIFYNATKPKKGKTSFSSVTYIKVFKPAKGIPLPTRCSKEK